MIPIPSFFHKRFVLGDGTLLLEVAFAPLSQDCSLVETHTAGQLVILQGMPFRVTHTTFSVEQGEVIMLRPLGGIDGA